MSSEYHKNVKVILNEGVTPWDQLMHLADVSICLATRLQVI